MNRTCKIETTGMGWLPDQAGGLNRYFYDLQNVLHEKGVNCRASVAGPCSLGEEAMSLQVASFARRDQSLPIRLWRARVMMRKIVERAPDLVVSHFALYTAPGLGRLGKIPLVCHFHGPWADESAEEGDRGFSNRFKRNLEGRVYRRATRLITLSEAFKQVLVERYGVQADRVRVIPGGVDLQRFSPLSNGEPTTEKNENSTRDAARLQLGWDLARPTIFCVRRLVPRMGIDRLIAAIGSLVKKHPHVQLMIAGRGPLAESLQTQIDSLGLVQNVRLLGFISDDDLPVAYRAADFSVVPTVALEGFGLIAAESLASGTPCLVTPVGGLPEVVGGLSKQLIFESSSIQAIAAGIDAALAHPRSLPDAVACRRYAEGHFHWCNLAERIVDVYEDAIATR